MRTVHQIVVSVLIRLLQPEENHWASVGSHGTFPAASVARAVLPRSTSDVRP
jgi:hypothetical protein